MTSRILAVNKALSGMFGYESESDFVGNDVSMLMPEPHRSRHSLFVEVLLNDNMRNSAGGVMGRTQELNAIRRDGSLFPVLVTLMIVDVAGVQFVTAIIRDLSSVRRRERNLQASIAETNSMLDTATAAFITIDVSGTVLRCNQAMYNLCGYSREELVGHNVSILMPSPTAEYHDRYLRSYLRTGTKRALGRVREVQMRTRDGHILAVELALGEVKTDAVHFL